VEEVAASPDGGWLVTLKLMTGSTAAELPGVGRDVCFSVHSTHRAPPLTLPDAEPWTHRPVLQIAAGPIEEDGKE
jgi:hypothetical protein